MAGEAREGNGSGSGGSRGGGPNGGAAKVGMRSLAALLPPVTRPAFRRKSPSAARILSDWGAIVGPALAERTEPRRFSAGVLTIACDGPTALELQHLAGKLAERINVQLGEAQVRQVRFVRGLVGTGAAAAAAGRRAPAAPVAVDGVEGRLGEALGRLGGAIAGRDGRRY